MDFCIKETCNIGEFHTWPLAQVPGESRRAVAEPLRGGGRAGCTTVASSFVPLRANGPVLAGPHGAGGGGTFDDVAPAVGVGVQVQVFSV